MKIETQFVLSENEQFIAVLERKPLVLGHVVVIAKRTEDHWFDLSPEELSQSMVFAKPIAKAIQKAIPCRKVGVAVIGLETRQAHLHLVPISSADDLNFTREKMTVSDEIFKSTLIRIRDELGQG